MIRMNKAMKKIKKGMSKLKMNNNQKNILPNHSRTKEDNCHDAKIAVPKFRH